MFRVRMIAAACAALTVCAAAPAQAGADRKPRPESSITPEAEALGVRLAHSLLETTQFEAWWVRKLARNVTAQKTFGLKQEPGWDGPMEDAVAEEFRHDMPALERMIGREFARGMPLDQLKANVAWVEGETGQLALHALFDPQVRSDPPSAASLKETGIQLQYLFKQGVRGGPFALEQALASGVMATAGSRYDPVRSYLQTHEGQTLVVLLLRVESRMEDRMIDELRPGVAERFEAKMAAVRAARPAASGKR